MINKITRKTAQLLHVNNFSYEVLVQVETLKIRQTLDKLLFKMQMLALILKARRLRVMKCLSRIPPQPFTVQSPSYFSTPLHQLTTH